MGNQDEIDSTVAVMGGTDWKLWIDALCKSNVLSQNCKTTAYTYLGSDVTSDIYWNGTIGAAKQHLDETAALLNAEYGKNDVIGLNASVSVLKAVIRQSSSAIPVMPLYLSLLFDVMKKKQLHEGTIEQIHRFFDECLYGSNGNDSVDKDGRYRVDDKEIKQEIQSKVAELWQIVNTENFKEISDFDGYKKGFQQLFGFCVDGIDYNQEVETEVAINNLYDAMAQEQTK